ncbi:hypothetical protein DYB32_006698 [Aphanomyces invadans]|uniref:Uncharacterized protein n=1 Tax=Aphanomyces invadans TaxID=157072 RepID=A0A418AQQ2_9STRA|nr:hypothetical protein DYB32_006698 [Aphanomyces invadans]
MVAAVTAYLCLIITLLAVATYAFYITYLTPVKSINAYISHRLTRSATGGIKASIATDAVKGGFVLLLVVIICIAAFSYTTLPANAFESTGIASFTTIGFEAVFTLTIAVVSSNLFLTGFWLRTFAAKNDADLRKACAYAALASTPFIVLLGVVGFMGYIMHPEAPVFDGGFFFYILLDMPEGWSILVLIVVAALVSSTADTIQTGMSAEILSNFQDRLSLPFARFISIIINIPAIFIALTDTSVLKLFLIADLLCAATVGPIFLGIWNRTHPTAVLAGCVSGLLTFVDGFNEFVLEEGLFTTHSMVLFILTLVIPVIVTVGLTFILPPAPKRSVPKNGNNELLVEAPVNHSSEHPYEASKSPAVV